MIRFDELAIKRNLREDLDFTLFLFKNGFYSQIWRTLPTYNLDSHDQTFQHSLEVKQDLKSHSCRPEFTPTWHPLGATPMAALLIHLDHTPLGSGHPNPTRFTPLESQPYRLTWEEKGKAPADDPPPRAICHRCQQHEHYFKDYLEYALNIGRDQHHHTPTTTNCALSERNIDLECYTSEVESA